MIKYFCDRCKHETAYYDFMTGENKVAYWRVRISDEYGPVKDIILCEHCFKGLKNYLDFENCEITFKHKEDEADA